jgi:leucyl/phenylalanyl-tRNA--protein transferase
MPIFRLTHEIVFPSPHLAEEDGLLAVGGDLSEERILKAYSMGIFPWYSEGSPVLWWSPHPRLVLFPDELRVSRSLRQCMNRRIFDITVNAAFDEVIRSCAAAARKGLAGTWITEEMIGAYTRLNHAGYAHSVESWHNGRLVGGLYGVIMGKVFFGESMFTEMSNASKVALVTFVEQLNQRHFKIIDCQVRTEHLISLGAREISRAAFLKVLNQALAAV